MIATGAMLGAEESGGFGFGMHLPERDGIYADLMLLELFLREKAAGRWPVSKAIAHFHEIAGPSFYRRIDVHVERAELRRDEAPPARRPRASRRRPSSTASRSRGPCRSTPNDGFKFFLADGSWLLIRTSAAPSRSSASTPRRRRPSCARRCSSPASAWSAARDDGDAGGPGTSPAPVDKPWGHELIWALTDRYCGKVITIETGRRLSLQYHEQKDEAILVTSGRLRLHLEDDAGDADDPRARARRGRPRRGRPAPPLRGDRAGRAHRGLDAGARRRRPDRGRLRPRRNVPALDRRGERADDMTDPRRLGSRGGGARWLRLAGVALAAALAAAGCDHAASPGSPGPAAGAASGGVAGGSPANASAVALLDPSAPGSATGSVGPPPPIGSPDASGSPGPVAGASSPAPGYDPAKFGFAAKGLRGEVMAFVTTSQVDDALARLDFESTSTIAFFSLVAGANGSISHDTRWRTWNTPRSTT